MSTSAILAPDPTSGEALPMTARPLDEYRLDRYMTVTEFCEFLGISLTTYYSITQRKEGHRTNFSTMKRVAKKLKVHPSEIGEFARKPSSEQEA